MGSHTKLSSVLRCVLSVRRNREAIAFGFWLLSWALQVTSAACDAVGEGRECSRHCRQQLSVFLTGFLSAQAHFGDCWLPLVCLDLCLVENVDRAIGEADNVLGWALRVRQAEGRCVRSATTGICGRHCGCLRATPTDSYSVTPPMWLVESGQAYWVLMSWVLERGSLRSV